MSPAKVCSSRAERERIVLAHTAHENEHVIDRTMETFARHRYEIVPTSQVFDGEAAVRALHEETLRAFPDFRVQTDRIHHTDDAVIVEARFIGTHTGSWRGFPPTGRSVDYPMCNVFVFEDSGLVCERMYFDTATILRQLALARDPETAAGKLEIVLAHPITTLSATIRALRS
jgi:steroid delta-isomerase-like uncharacterized protein